jgi:hypothetical protein
MTKGDASIDELCLRFAAIQKNWLGSLDRIANSLGTGAVGEEDMLLSGLSFS